jgi:hypothetical protein
MPIPKGGGWEFKSRARRIPEAIKCTKSDLDLGSQYSTIDGLYKTMSYKEVLTTMQEL